jgi:hypothetical protein
MKDYKKYLNPANKVPMIEVLGDNDLVRHINKTHKKVSIKHYLNTYLFPVGENDNGEHLYPLYFRVIFNKQSVKIKSSINKAFSVREFEAGEFGALGYGFGRDTFYWDLMTREALSLTYIISDFFIKGINAAEREINPSARHDLSGRIDDRDNRRYQEEAVQSVIQNFDINLLFKNFKFSDYELPSIVEDKLFDAIDLFSLKYDLGHDVDTFYLHRDKLNAFQYIQFLKSKNSAWEEFENRFPKSIWFFNIYYYQFITHSREYKDLGATTVDLLYLDFDKQLNDSSAGREIEKALMDIRQLVNTEQLSLKL